jgi:autotransporter-associated beta strand protein
MPTLTWNGATSAYQDAGNWTGAGAPPPDASGEAAIFAATGVTSIAVAGTVNPDSWTFAAASQSYAISGDSVTLGGAGVVNGSSAAQSIANVIAGSGGLQQNGSGTLTLSGANTYTGGTTINAGTLRIGDGGTTGSIVGDVIDDGAVIFSRSNSGQIIGGTISGSGTVAVQNTPFAGFTLFTGNNTYSGGTTIASGTLVLGTGGNSGSIVGDVLDNDLLTFNRSDSLIFDGQISGSGGVTKFGGGTLTLTADNSYTNGTVIAAGALQLGDGGTTGNIGSSTVNDGGALVFDRSDVLTFNASIFGSGAVAQLGTGTTVLAGNNSYSGGTTLVAGTLDLAAAHAAGSGAIAFGLGEQTLRLENAALAGNAFDNTIKSFDVGDVIDLPGLAFAAGATATYDSSTASLMVASSGVSDTLKIVDPTEAIFVAEADGTGGTQVILTHFVVGGPGDDSISGSAGDDVILGGAGNDALGGKAGNDIIVGQDGTDVIGGDDGNDKINGGDGNDTIFGGAGNDELGGGTGNDIIVGNDGDDTIWGEDGNDHVNGGAGDDIIIGGAGSDELGGGAGNDVIVGDDGDDVLFGEDGNDNLNGGAGNDVLVGGAGDDQLGGGAGDDIVVGNDGNDVVFGEGGNDKMNGGAGNDVIKGGDGNDELGGGTGNDDINGGAGNDTLWGEDGDDTLNGSTGNDILLGMGGNDMFAFTTGDGTDTITDFTAGADHVWFYATNLHSFADVQSRATFNAGTGATTISYDGGTLTLNGVALNQLHASDFIFT